MKKQQTFIVKRTLAFILFAIAGYVMVMGSTIVPFGQWSKEPWEAKGFYAAIEEQAPEGEWYSPQYDDSAWEDVQGPLGTSSLSYKNTAWEANYSKWWLRRKFVLESIDEGHKYIIYVLHDDECRIYLNGTEIYYNPDCTPHIYNKIVLTGDTLKALKTGDNLLAVYVGDTGGGEKFIDFGLYDEFDISTDINNSSNVEVEVINDATYPWTVDGEGILQNGNCGIAQTTSNLTLSYDATYRQELTFDWCSYNAQAHPAMQLVIDGVVQGSTSNSSWTSMRLYLDAGSHIIQFRDTIGNSTNTSNYSKIRNLHIKEILPLETAVLTKNSLPLTFENNGEWPWTIGGSSIQNSNYNHKNTASKFSTTFTIDKTSKLSYYHYTRNELAGSRADYYYDYHSFRCNINGKNYHYTNYSSGYIKIVLEPGTYTVEWRDTIMQYDYPFKTTVSSIELSSNWIDVTLGQAGTLGAEVLEKVNELHDVEFLKVAGPLNDDDWAKIRQMNNLLAIDLTDATFDVLPTKAFGGLSLLQDVKLPEGLTTIGVNAFSGTTLRRVNIPSTVLSIQQSAFYDKALLENVEIAANSQLKDIGKWAFFNCSSLRTFAAETATQLRSIGYGAFAKCSLLREFIMPASVTYVDANAFWSCSSLTKLHFSDAITAIYAQTCDGCSSLTDLHLPQSLRTIYFAAFANIPSLRTVVFPDRLNIIQRHAFYACGVDSVRLPIKLEYLGEEAFQNCTNLKYVELPSYLRSSQYTYTYYYDNSSTYDRPYSSNTDTYYGYRNNFPGCTSIQTVVCPSATPPAQTSDLFPNKSKSSITLKVPSFAVVSYKLNDYWYQYKIVEGDDIGYWKITSELLLMNNRRMAGKPDIDLMSGGRLTVGGNAPMEIGLLNVWQGGQLLSQCDNISADSINTYYNISANTWHFLAPLYDVDLTKVSVNTNAPYIFRYYNGEHRAENGASGKGSWQDVADGMLHAGQGYIFQTSQAGTLTLPAEPTGRHLLFSTADVALPLATHEVENTADKSWNYMGNPYPTYYDVYYMDFTAPITVRDGNTYKAYSIIDDELVLAPMQPFFVQKPDGVENIVFHKEGRQFSTTVSHPSNARYRLEKTDVRKLFNLSLSAGGGQADQTRVVINPRAQLGYEMTCDAAKFMSTGDGIPQVFTLDRDGIHCAINERPLSDGIVILGYYASEATELTISMSRADDDIWLTDHETDKVVNLREQPYTFQTEAMSQPCLVRFTLSFGGTPTGLPEVVKGESRESEYYDLSGRKLSASPERGIYIKDGKKQIK